MCWWRVRPDVDVIPVKGNKAEGGERGCACTHGGWVVGSQVLFGCLPGARLSEIRTLRRPVVKYKVTETPHLS